MFLAAVGVIVQSDLTESESSVDQQESQISG